MPVWSNETIGLVCLSDYRVFNLKVDHILMSNLFTKIYNMLYYTTNLYLQ